jgi:hypothetical protein
MIGDERARFCGRCAKEVYDISAMNRVEAERFLREQTGRVCVTFRRRRDGKVMTSDCDVGARRRRFGIGVVALAVVGAASAFALHHDDTCRAHRTRSAHRPHVAKEAMETGQMVVSPSQRRMTEAHESSPRTTGCACLPGDPLCACL